MEESLLLNDPQLPLPTSSSVIVESDNFSITLTISSDLPFFKGHFPKEPVVPGYILVGWAVEYATQIFKEDIHVTEIKGLKFHRIVKPSEIITLKMTRESNRNFRFLYAASDSDAVARGELVVG